MNEVIFRHLSSIEPSQRSQSVYWTELVNAASELQSNGFDIDPIDAALFFLTQ